MGSRGSSSGVQPKSFNGARDANRFFGSTSGKWRQWWNGLEQDEQSAIMAYTGSAYGGINRFLRHGGASSPTLQRRINGISDALNKSELRKDIVVYRGTTKSFFAGKDHSLEELQEMGKYKISFVDKGFSSAAVTEGRAWKHKGYILEIHVPKGKGRGSWVDPISQNRGEQEFLLQKNMMYTITGARMSDDGHTPIVSVKVNTKWNGGQNAVKKVTKVG